MTLNVTDTVKSAFDDVFSKLGAIALLGQIGIGLIYGASLGLFSMGGTAGSVLGSIGFGVYLLAAFAFSVGIFRVFSNGDFDIEYFKNFGWPGFRIFVGSLTIFNLAGLALYALVLPIVFLAGVGSVASGTASAGALGALAGAGILAGVLGIIGVAIAIYIVTSLILAIPMIPIEGRRMFEALDEAVQRSKSNRGRMFVTALPSILLVLIGVTVLGALGGGAVGLAIYLALAVIAGIYHLSLLAQLVSRL